MKNHLTEQQLLEYQFKLASDSVMQQAAEHLKLCDACRENLEKLQKKFAALDLLSGDVKVSEDLIARTTQQATQSARTKIVPLYRKTWTRAIAAVILVGALVLVSQIGRQDTRRNQVAQETEPTVRKENVAASGKRELAERLADSSRADLKMFAAAPTSRVTKGQSAPVGTDMIAEMEVTEKPPFAPASAIELVTLPRRDNVQLTIYNSADLTLVREKRSLTMKKGWNWLQFMWANTLIDPTSLSLEPLAQADKIDIQQLVFPARLRELGRWLIRSEVSGQVPFEITYFTSGLSWRAFYTGTLSPDEKTMRLAGFVRVANGSGEDYENAQTRLIVGQVHLLDEIAGLAGRQYPYDRPGLERRSGRGEMNEFRKRLEDSDFEGGMGGMGGYDGRMAGMKPKEITKEGLSEYFLYTIEGTETIPNQWAKRLLSFNVADIEVDSLYKYDEERWGDQTIRFVSFANDEEHNLGETPIPNGDVKIYSRADSEGHLSYVGGTNIKYIPVDEEIELNLGPARLVKIEPKLMDFKIDNYMFDDKGNISGWDEIRTWKIEITNTRALPVEIEITRGFGTAYWTLQSEIDFVKHDATHARFELSLEPGNKEAFEYTVTTCHGTREELMNQQ